MINAGKLLADLKRLRKVLDADLRATHATGAQRDAVQAEWQEAFDLGRTRDRFEAFLDSAFDQAVVHWVLGCVFLRFLEDNLLVDRPFLSGPGERLDLAKERQEAHFRALPHASDTEYLLATFGEAARLPGMAGLFDPAHNPLFRLPISGDGAMALIRFLREVLPETGDLAHDFTDPEWNTRFLGDLYQDLSEEARDRYALLQTPDFVESWILDRTLDPAINEFGYEFTTIIDPACGSGHFLLGGFERLLRKWQTFAPGLPPAEQAQRALDSIAGVDLNPFAVEIARFRLLIAAIQAAEVRRIRAAPKFRMHLAAGDSLLHGRHFFRHELGGTNEGFRRTLRHHYRSEDTAEIDVILGKQYHAVVGNPPYIVPRDSAMREAYREIYSCCFMNYSMVAPFVERMFDLAMPARGDQRGAGFVGAIVANSFLRREFGAKLVEETLPKIDITHVVDCSKAYIPGHGTPTVILFGRNRLPTSSQVRVVVGLRGEKGVPELPAQAPVWSAITRAIDAVGMTNPYAESIDVLRRKLEKHPVFLGSSAEMRLVDLMGTNSWSPLSNWLTDAGRVMASGEDDFFFVENSPRWLEVSGSVCDFSKGDNCRDWSEGSPSKSFLPPYYLKNSSEKAGNRAFWSFRSTLINRKLFGRKISDVRGDWRAFSEHYVQRQEHTPKIVFPLVATHNHFVPSSQRILMNHSAPVLILKTSEAIDHLASLLNSSIACFWMKSVFYPKGGDQVGQQGARLNKSPWDERYEFSCTGIERFPVAPIGAEVLAAQIGRLGKEYSELQPEALLARNTPSRSLLASARERAGSIRRQMIALQEELDWICYGSYGVGGDLPVCGNPPEINFGERAFEIVMARRMANSELETEWFARHGSHPMQCVLDNWPNEYQDVVQKRIALIEREATIGVLERPEYKRRWSGANWDEQEREAIRRWMLNRIEDHPVWVEGDPRLLSATQVADIMRRDADFVSVAALYAGRDDGDLEALVSDLVMRESVPFLDRLRYGEAGLRKRKQWEATWNKQRHEDAIDAEVSARRDTFRVQAERWAQEQWQAVNPRRPGEQPEPYAIRMQAGAAPGVEHQIDRLVTEEQRRRKRDEVGDIPVPPKYVTKDFQSTDFWRLRGGLDVPKERFVSFPKPDEPEPIGLV